jgi:hypothetical protein
MSVFIKFLLLSAAFLGAASHIQLKASDKADYIVAEFIEKHGDMLKEYGIIPDHGFLVEVAKKIFYSTKQPASSESSKELTAGETGIYATIAAAIAKVKAVGVATGKIASNSVGLVYAHPFIAGAAIVGGVIFYLWVTSKSSKEICLEQHLEAMAVLAHQLAQDGYIFNGREMTQAELKYLILKTATECSLPELVRQI